MTAACCFSLLGEFAIKRKAGLNAWIHATLAGNIYAAAFHIFIEKHDLNETTTLYMSAESCGEDASKNVHMSIEK